MNYKKSNIIMVKASMIAILIALFALIPQQSRAQSSQKITMAIISFSPYAPWYIVKEKALAKNIDLDIKIIEDITAKNAGLAGGQINCMMNTLDSVVVARSAGVPVKVISIPALSYGLDEMVVDKSIQSVSDFSGKSYGADFGFLNHMWMLLTLKKAGIAFDEVSHKIMLPQDSAAAFVSGGLDIDVNYKPFSSQSLTREGAHVFKSSLSDKTWERGLISESLSCNESWLADNGDAAKELLRAWFEAVDWWKENPEEGNALVAKGLDWPMADVKLTQYGAIMLSMDQNLGAFGIGDGKPPCASLPEGIVAAPDAASEWGNLLFNGAPDCAAGYIHGTWDLFNNVYKEAGVTENVVASAEAMDSSILSNLASEGFVAKYKSNKWIGRLGQ